MSTLVQDTSMIWQDLRGLWPDLEGARLDSKHGAFHQVALLGDSSVVRVASAPRHEEQTLQWCGGDRWPTIIEQLFTALDETVASAARRVVADVLTTEPHNGHTLVHGDFGLHNLLWSGDTLPTIIDWDNASVISAFATSHWITSPSASSPIRENGGVEMCGAGDLFESPLLVQGN
jgi:Ser/Thr protein kinase RdoA (MazF antagonist)